VVDEALQIDFSTKVETGADETDKINYFAEKLDFLDIQILRKFYSTGKEFPNDCQPYCFPVLYSEMKVERRLKIGLEALRKRLENMVGLGLLEKVRNSNPTNYYPIRNKEGILRAVIMKFFLINGLTKYL